jgi:hypothetical protein
MVVGLADVRNAEVIDALMRQRIEETGGLQVAEMSEVACDSTLQTLGIGAIPQQIRIMIELKDQCVAVLEHLLHVRCDAPGVRQHPQAPSIRLEQKLAWLAGIMRDRV